MLNKKPSVADNFDLISGARKVICLSFTIFLFIYYFTTNYRNFEILKMFGPRS